MLNVCLLSAGFGAIEHGAGEAHLFDLMRKKDLRSDQRRVLSITTIPL